jgi:hypothetical protein
MVTNPCEGCAGLHRRAGMQWISEILRGADARFASTTVGIEIGRADLYEEEIALVEGEVLGCQTWNRQGHQGQHQPIEQRL